MRIVIRKHWLNSLPPKRRERVYAWMRAWGLRALEQEKRARGLSEISGKLGLGAAGFAEWVQASSTQEFLQALRDGLSPKQARIRVMEYARLCVQKHNARDLGGDVHWTRWEGTADGTILFLEGSVKRAAKILRFKT